MNIKFIVRNLRRNPAYSCITIGGLVVGITSYLLIATVVLDDLSYDRFWAKSSDLYRVISIRNDIQTGSSKLSISLSGLGPTLKRLFPEVKDYCRMTTEPRQIKFRDNFQAVGLETLIAEPSIWELLNFDILFGAPKQFVNGYPNLIITEEVKDRFFPNSDPIGKIVTSESSTGSPQKLIITGVIKNIPENTHLRSEAIILAEFPSSGNNLNKEEFGTLYPQYLFINSKTDIPLFTKRINKWYESFIANKRAVYSFNFQPIKDVYLHSEFSSDQKVVGSINTVYILGIISVLILILSCSNFINITIARMLRRLRETGIRKVIGAQKSDIIFQFLEETLLIFSLSFLISFLIYLLLIRNLEVFLGYRLTFTVYHNIWIIVLFYASIAITSILTGLYPAILIARPRPAIELKNQVSDRIRSVWISKSLIIFQFLTSTLIFIAALVIRSQMALMSNYNLGFDAENLLEVNYGAWEGKGAALKEAIKRLPEIETISITSWVPSDHGGDVSFDIEDPNDPGKKISAWYIEGDIDLANTLKLHLKQGRLLNNANIHDAVNSDSLMEKDFSKLINVQKVQPILITSSTASMLHIKALNTFMPHADGIPVGIVEDFHNESLKFNLKPTFIRANANPNYGKLLIRIKAGKQQAAVAKLHQILQSFYPEKIFDFSWIKDSLDSQYNEENKLQQLFVLFSFLTIFLACLGLTGLSIFVFHQRLKEISIRKVVGASTTTILGLLLRDFLLLSLTAVVIALPISALVMQKWLETYPYRITLQWWYFALGSVVCLISAFFAIILQSARCSSVNPINYLKSE